MVAASIIVPLFFLTATATQDTSATCRDVHAEPKIQQCLMQKKRNILPKARDISRSLSAPSTDLYQVLPLPIHSLGLKLFGSEEALSQVVENSIVVDLEYAGVDVTLRMNKDDDATTRMGEEGHNRFWATDMMDSMGDARETSKDMLNMLDVGASYGVVTIAAFKKYPELLRVVAVEPIPTTFFFLKWNLYLNGVPEIDQDTVKSHLAPGVMALNTGTAEKAGEDLHLCFDPSSSMNARGCECAEGDDRCVIVQSVTVSSLASMFGKEPIAMLKMDCEGCEFDSLLGLDKPEVSQRVKRFAGELHLPYAGLEEIACNWEMGRLVSKCHFAKGNGTVPPSQEKLRAWKGRSEVPDPIECGVKLGCIKTEQTPAKN